MQKGENHYREKRNKSHLSLTKKSFPMILLGGGCIETHNLFPEYKSK